MSCTCLSNPHAPCVAHPVTALPLSGGVKPDMSPPVIAPSLPQAIPVPTGVIPLTIEEFKASLPDKVKKSVNPALIAQINKTLSDPELYENYRDNLVSYTSVMQDGKFKITSYLSAVMYASHKLRGMTNLDAYSKTFPEKIQRFTKQGVKPKDIASYVTAYNKSKLVNLIMEQTMVPFYVLNQDMYQKALNTQAELMVGANSEKVRSDAANSILTHLKPPETQKIELDIGVKKDSSISQLRDATMALVAEQRKALQAGALNAQEVAHSKVVIDNDTQEIE